MGIESFAAGRERAGNADVLDLLVLDDRASAEATKAAIIDALPRVAGEHGGCVAIPWIRPLLPERFHPPTVGATITGLVRSGRLRWTGAIVASGNAAQRNGLRPAKVYQLIESGPSNDRALTK